MVSFLLFAAWRAADFLIAYLAPTIIAHNQPLRFIYTLEPWLPKFLVGFTNFDGEHFLHIATSGYAAYEQAFSPPLPAAYQGVHPVYPESVLGRFFAVQRYDLYKVWLAKAGPKRTQRLGLSLFSLATLLFPTLTGTFSSLPRYALFSLAWFVRLAEVRSAVVKTIMLTLFLSVHIAALMLFIQSYFVG